MPGRRREALPNTRVCLVAESSATSAVQDMRRFPERRAARQVTESDPWAGTEGKEGGRHAHVKGSRVCPGSQGRGAMPGPEDGGWKQQISYAVPSLSPVQAALSTLATQTPILTCLYLRTRRRLPALSSSRADCPHISVSAQPCWRRMGCGNTEPPRLTLLGPDSLGRVGVGATGRLGFPKVRQGPHRWPGGPSDSVAPMNLPDPSFNPSHPWGQCRGGFVVPLKSWLLHESRM